MPSFFRELKWELFKVLRRKRVLLACAATLAFEVLMLVLLQHPAAQEEVRRAFLKLGYTFVENFTGPTVAAFASVNTMTILGNLFTALVAGEMIAREVEDGTLRMTLCRPVPRGRLFLAKVTACLSFTALVVFFIFASSLLLGLLYRGTGHWLVVIPKESFVAHHQFVPGLARYAGAALLNIASSACVPLLAFMFSALRMKPAAAAVLALATFIIDDTLRSMPFFASAKGYFMVTHVVTWIHIYQPRIPWVKMRADYAVLAVLYATWLAIAWRAFQRQELKP